MNDLRKHSHFISTVSDSSLSSLLWHGNDKFNDTDNRKLLMTTMRFIKDSKRFDEQR